MTDPTEELTPDQREMLEWTERMIEASKHLTAGQRADLKAWEDKYCGTGPGSLEGMGTSDSPGWVPLVGEPPYGRRG